MHPQDCAREAVAQCGERRRAQVGDHHAAPGDRVALRQQAHRRGTIAVVHQLARSEERRGGEV